MRLSATLTARSRIGQFVHDWQELIVWKPVLLTILLIAFFVMPRLDPRTGIDGFGSLFGLNLQVVVLAVIWFAVWLIKRTYWRVLDDDVERELFDDFRRGDPNAFRVLLFDRLEWVFIVCIVLYALR